jgi:hypothetical protein
MAVSGDPDSPKSLDPLQKLAEVTGWNLHANRHEPWAHNQPRKSIFTGTPYQVRGRLLPCSYATHPLTAVRAAS